MMEIKILIEGYSEEISEDKVEAEGTITLVKSTKNTIIDTGNVGSAKKIINELSKENLIPEDIDFVVNTHGDLDHIGNNGLFVNAAFIGFGSVCRGDKFDFFDGEFVINENVKVVKTPGHSMLDVSVIIKTDKGIVVAAGDIFENEKDQDGSKAKKWSMNWEKQLESRKKLLEIADYIIPGHGKMFKVEK